MSDITKAETEALGARALSLRVGGAAEEDSVALILRPFKITSNGDQVTFRAGGRLRGRARFFDGVLVNFLVQGPDDRSGGPPDFGLGSPYSLIGRADNYAPRWRLLSPLEQLAGVYEQEG